MESFAPVGCASTHRCLRNEWLTPHRCALNFSGSIRTRLAESSADPDQYSGPNPHRISASRFSLAASAHGPGGGVSSQGLRGLVSRPAFFARADRSKNGQPKQSNPLAKSEATDTLSYPFKARRQFLRFRAPLRARRVNRTGAITNPVRTAPKNEKSHFESPRLTLTSTDG
jgi:hypothetical protein